MSYEIHIGREPPITLTEWEGAVQSTEGVRLDASGASAVNPTTGQRIEIRGRKGDAQALVGNNWLLVFRWHEGAVSFKAPADFDEPTSILRSLARSLARKLDAHVVGDEGEEYE